MFAAAAREVVFSHPDVINRINTNFIPVALKAAQVNRPPAGLEGKIYAEIGRSQPAAQGICTINSQGKVLAWALSFDHDRAIGEFLNHVVERYQQSSHTDFVTAERFMRYPSHPLDDVPDNGVRLNIPLKHGAGDVCPATPKLQDGSLVGRIVGRALDEAGNPLPETKFQENYMESRVVIEPAAQRQLALAARDAGGQRFRLPALLTRAIVGNAYLGQLDVDPSGKIPGTKNTARYLEFHGIEQKSDNGDLLRIKISGMSNLEGSHDALGRRTDGRNWEHRVTLNWFGYIDLKGQRIANLTISAAGDERLRWTLPGPISPGTARAQYLMAGHPIDLECGVRYGLFANSAE